MIPGHTTPEQSQRAKALGFPQNYLGVYWVQDGEFAVPVLISGDPGAPGVVEWMESKGWRVTRNIIGYWNAHKLEPQFKLPALIDLVLTEMEKGLWSN